MDGLLHPTPEATDQPLPHYIAQQLALPGSYYGVLGKPLLQYDLWRHLKVYRPLVMTAQYTGHDRAVLLFEDAELAADFATTLHEARARRLRRGGILPTPAEQPDD